MNTNFPILIATYIVMERLYLLIEAHHHSIYKNKKAE